MPATQTGEGLINAHSWLAKQIAGRSTVLGRTGIVLILARSSFELMKRRCSKPCGGRCDCRYRNNEEESSLPAEVSSSNMHLSMPAMLGGAVGVLGDLQTEYSSKLAATWLCFLTKRCWCSEMSAKHVFSDLSCSSPAPQGTLNPKHAVTVRLGWPSKRIASPKNGRH